MGQPALAIDVVNLEGVIDENFDFQKVLGGISGKTLFINCEKVKKINSIGVKAWISFFQDFNKVNEVTYQNMSIVLVEQLNSVMNFACGAKIESIMAPFMCPDCGHESSSQLTVDFLRRSTTIADAKCPNCGSLAEFDDMPEEYFSFLEYYNK